MLASILSASIASSRWHAMLLGKRDQDWRLTHPVIPEHGAAGGVLVLTLLQAEVCFGVREHALVVAGQPDLAPGSMRDLSARLVDRLQMQRRHCETCSKAHPPAQMMPPQPQLKM